MVETVVRLQQLPMHIETTRRGIRLRKTPGLGGKILGTFPRHATALATLGPLQIDGYSWYEVSDDSGTEPAFESGWMAVGTPADPWVKESLGWGGGLFPSLVFDGLGSQTFGPLDVTPSDVRGISWAAAGDRCHLQIDVLGTGGARIRLMSDRVPSFVHGADGGFFQRTPEVGTEVSLAVESDCSWAISLWLPQE